MEEEKSSGAEGAALFRRADVESRRIPAAATAAAGAGSGGATFDTDLLHRSLADVLPSGVDSATLGVALDGDAGFELTDDAARAVVADMSSASGPLQAVPGSAKPGSVAGVPPMAPSIMPPAIPGFPMPLDRSTQSIVGVTAVDLIGTVRDGLVTSAVDFSFDADKCKFKCVCFNKGCDTDFRVFLYTVSDRTFALEFQRRSGDAYLYHTIKKRVWDSVDRRFKGARCSFERPQTSPQDRLQGPSLPKSACDFSAIKLTRPLSEDFAQKNASTTPKQQTVKPAAVSKFDPADETMSVLSHLLSSTCSEDVRAQGVRSAAVACSDDDIRTKIVSAGLVPALCQALSGGSDIEPDNGGDLATRCHAASAIANLSESRDSHAALVAVDGLLRVLFRLTMTSHEARSAQLRREAARAVANLAATQGRMMSKSGGIDAVREVLGDSRADHVMREHAFKAQQAMGVV